MENARDLLGEAIMTRFCTEATTYSTQGTISPPSHVGGSKMMIKPPAHNASAVIAERIFIWTCGALFSDNGDNVRGSGEKRDKH